MGVKRDAIAPPASRYYVVRYLLQYSTFRDFEKKKTIERSTGTGNQCSISTVPDTIISLPVLFAREPIRVKKKRDAAFCDVYAMG